MKCRVQRALEISQINKEKMKDVNFDYKFKIKVAPLNHPFICSLLTWIVIAVNITTIMAGCVLLDVSREAHLPML